MLHLLALQVSYRQSQTTFTSFTGELQVEWDYIYPPLGCDHLSLESSECPIMFIPSYKNNQINLCCYSVKQGNGIELPSTTCSVLPIGYHWKLQSLFSDVVSFQIPLTKHPKEIKLSNEGSVQLKSITKRPMNIYSF